MARWWGVRTAASFVAVGMAAAACSADPGPPIVLGEVTVGEVVETVAAPATLEPRDRVSVAAPASGTVAELLVADGDRVEQGDPLVRLTAPSVEQTIAQAQAAVEAADALAGVQAGVDLSPLIGAVRDQLDAVVPGLLDLLDDQASALPEDGRDDAREAIASARSQYEEAQDRLAAAEAEAAGTAASATASQRAAAEAQRRQAELALEAAELRADDLTVTAPAGGVVELARGDAAPATGDLGALEGLGGDGQADMSGLEGLLGGGGTASRVGPIAEGTEVTAGQALLTVFDLGAFRAQGEVDEIDVVDVAEGQTVTVLVDAFPTAEMAGIVEHVAIEPRSGVAGGVVYAVTVDLRSVPDDVGLRVGLSGSIEIVTATIESDTVIPSSALRRRGASDVVFVARDGAVRQVDVTIVAIGDDEAAVEGDLASGDLVVVEGIDEIADGDSIPDDAATR